MKTDLELGFHNLMTRWIYIGTTEGSTSAWYFWNHKEEKQDPIENNSLVCYLKNVELQEREYKNKTKDKLVLTVQADERYKIQSGLTTWFSKILLNKLAALTEDQIKDKIIISPYLGGEENVVFCSLKDAEQSPIGLSSEALTEEDYSVSRLLEIVKILELKLTGQPVPTQVLSGTEWEAIRNLVKQSYKENNWTEEDFSFLIQEHFKKEKFDQTFTKEQAMQLNELLCVKAVTPEVISKELDLDEIPY